jgi:ABC-type spermidine/putrescine transport system permease subunit I
MAEMNDPFANTATVPAGRGRRIVSIALALNVIAVLTAYAAYSDWVSRRSLVLLLVVFPWITLLLVRIFRPALYLNRELKITNVTLAVVGPGLALLYLSLSDSTPIHWLKPTILTI